MGDMPGYLRTCLQTGKLFFLAILVSGGIVLQVLACALYDNWWPLLTGREMRDFLEPKLSLEWFLIVRFKIVYFSRPSTVTLQGIAIMYVLLPMPLLFFAGSDMSSLISESSNSWVDVSKFLTGFSAVGSIAIPSILKHAGIIGWGALGMQLASYLVFVLAIICFIQMNDDDDGYSSIF